MFIRLKSSSTLADIGLASSVMSALSRNWKKSASFNDYENSHLSRLSAVLSVLLYAAETRTLLNADSRALEAFHMKCQRQLLQIKWHQFIRNDESTGLPSISHRRNSLFGHVARLQEDVPAHKALNWHVDLSLGRPPSSQRNRRPDSPRNRWVDQIRRDNNLPPVDLWMRAVSRGHRGLYR